MYISDGFDRFRKNVIDKTGHDISGQTVYLIQTEDMEGNITDEKYGINLRTDLGMLDNDGTRVVMFLGTGTTPSSYTDVYMENINSIFSAQMSSGDNVWTTEYDSTTGMITTSAWTDYVTYEYNITGVSSDIVFTEIGTSEMGGSSYGGYYYDKLTTRSLIYDQEGHVSSITKRLNEKLTIKIYKSFSMHEDVIIDAYDRGDYLLINMIGEGVYRSGGTSSANAYSIAFSSSRSDNGGSQVETVSCAKDRYSADDDVGLNTSNYSNFVSAGSSSRVIENKNFYYDKLYTMPSNRFVFVKKVKLDTPETLEFKGVYTNDQSDGSLTNTFGASNRNYTRMSGVLPVTDLKITDSKSFNYISGNWDIQDSFNNIRYDLFRWKNSTGSLCMSFNAIDPSSQSDSTFYVCVNDDDSKQLTSIWTSDGSTFYLAEKYWDTSTWVQVSLDPGSRYINTIPAEAKYYRYFISKGTNMSNVEFIRDGLKPAITDVFTPYAIANVPAHTRYSPIFIPITSETYKWILIESHVLAMNNDGTIAYSHRVYGDSNDSDIDLAYIRAGFDNKLVVSSYATYESTPRNIRIYDMTTMTSDNAPTYVDVAITSSAFGDKCYFTKSTSYGYVAIWVPMDSSKRANIIDINTGTNVIIQDAIMFHIQDFTPYAIYGVTGTTPFQFNVYDLRTNEVVDTFTIPAEHTEAMFTSVCGCGDNFYIQFGSGTSQVVYMYTLSTKQLSVLGGVALNLDSSYTGYTNLPYHYPAENRVRCYHPDGMIISGKNGETLFITASDPANPIRLFSNDRAEIEAINLYAGLVSHIAEYEPDGNTSHLLLLDSYNGQGSYNHSERRHAIADIGVAFKTHSSIFNPYARWTEEYVNWSGSEYEVGGVALYNGKIYVFNGPTNSKVYPLKTALPHKLTVQTYTYQQYNNPKSYNFAGRYNIARSNHGDIIAMPSPPATFNISGAADGSGTGMRFKSYWKWRDYGSSQFALISRNDTGTGGGEFALGLNKAFKVLPGNVVTASVTLKNTITHISRLDVELFVVEDTGTDPISVRVAYSKHLAGDIGSGITIPTGSYSTQYLRIFLNIRAYNSSNNLVPIVATYIDTYSVTVT